ncbi:hypothetical protein GALMADRAFT_571288 [Galerina marginata CBS 339.88]|uniref:Nephrocystin 3-like N-terminal domain-containing protein n=1 Tax=Galerina marginata (strain CBS 339.88) TaxID=685588 RepID=A0A067STJ5_GALM3|nr:hypothetical protein GALMADRAFT_571288 [Galerina marginata CBS 339.88]
MARRREPNLPPGFLQDFRGATIQSGSGGSNGRGGDIGSHNVHAVFNVAGTHNHGFELLAKAACPSAFHDSGDSCDRPKCHPETRLEVQREIMNWTKNPKESVMWVSGGPGVGKSAIARTMAELLAKDGRLAACFCFSRTDSDRNCIKSLAATIAYHAILHIPQLESDISRVVERNPLIFDLSFETQFRSLIVKPFGKLAKQGYFTAPSRARVVIIDGLDECVNKNSQLEIVNSICSSLERGNFPLLFLIASRREPQLLNMFENGAIRKLLTKLNLDTSFSPDNDIRVFLKSSFNNINKTHRLSAFIPQPWPHPHAIGNLVGKSSGQFIYASLVVKYVSSLSHLPHQRLDIILGLRPVDKGAPFAELDELYTHILKSVHDDHIDSALMLLRLVIFSDCSAIPLKGLMGKILELDPGQLQIIIGELGSTLKERLCVGRDQSDSFIKLAHASFGDYLRDKSRSKSFYLDQDISHSLLASLYLRLLITRRVLVTTATPLIENSSITAYMPTNSPPSFNGISSIYLAVHCLTFFQATSIVLWTFLCAGSYVITGCPNTS